MTEVTRGTFGPFGTACTATPSGRYVAWGGQGPMTGDNPLDEPADPIWFHFGDSPAEALEYLAKELRGLLH